MLLCAERTEKYKVILIIPAMLIDTAYLLTFRADNRSMFLDKRRKGVKCLPELISKF